VGFVCFQILGSYAQDQNEADRLLKIYQEDKLEGSAKLELLENLSFIESNDFDLALKYAEELIVLAKIENNNKFLSKGYVQKGNANRVLGNLQRALEAYFNAAEAAVAFYNEDKKSSIANEGVAYFSIADVYSEMGNSDNAQIYYTKAIDLLRKTDDTISLASALINAGDEAFNVKKYDKALAYFEESGIIFKNENYLIGTAYNKGNVGMVYAEQGKNALAEANIKEAIVILEELEDYSSITEYLIYMSDIYLKKEDLLTALTYAQRSLDLSKKYGLKKQIGDANLKLSELYEEKGDQVTSFKFYKDHIIYRDSLINLKKIQESADTRTNYEVAQEKVKTELSEQKRKTQRIVFWSLVGVSLFIIYLAYSLFKRNTYIKKTNTIIEAEKQRSDDLLLNILPEETAQELKEKGRVEPRRFEAATILFSDFKGFTHYAENLSPKVLVKTIDHYFSAFDLIMEKYNLEKIKTVGDAYMAAGGLPFETEDHAHKMILAAQEMADFVAKAKGDDKTTAKFDIRIGINTGPVVAGVVGTKKFAYDIWGDAVNIASRMESNSDPGRINISEMTYNIVKSQFDCEYRGEIAVKNRGQMKMYFVKS
jgi:class 3 adenylate cyclase